MAQPKKRSSLATLPKTRLLELASGFEVEHRKNDNKAALIDALAQSKRASFEKVLALLSRDELKEICRAHGIDDSGRAKQPIVERVLGQEQAPKLPGLFEDAVESAAETTPTAVATNASETPAITAPRAPSPTPSHQPAVRQSPGPRAPELLELPQASRRSRSQDLRLTPPRRRTKPHNGLVHAPAVATRHITPNTRRQP